MPVDLLDVSSLDGAMAHGALPGELLAGKYRVERVLGRGGMGVVVLARNVRLDQHVAIKFLGREATRELSGRLLREARAAARLTSDHVVRVFDVAEMDDGAPYIVMEYLQGEALDQLLRRATRVPWTQAVQWVLEACEGLALAHQHAIVHRDLKPANLFLERRPDGTNRVKVLDFGVAKLDHGLGNTTHPVGSPAYMAPEQLESGHDIDARTDVWGIGIVLYELVTGSTPYRASSLLELALQVREARHVPARERCAELPPGLSNVIERCLRKRREERYRSVGELAAALCAFGPVGSSAIAARVERLAAPEPPGAPAPDLAASSSGRSLPGLATTLAGPATVHPGGGRRTTLAALIAVGVSVASAAALRPHPGGPLQGEARPDRERWSAPLQPLHGAAPASASTSPIAPPRAAASSAAAPASVAPGSQHGRTPPNDDGAAALAPHSGASSSAAVPAHTSAPARVPLTQRVARGDSGVTRDDEERGVTPAASSGDASDARRLARAQRDPRSATRRAEVAQPSLPAAPASDAAARRAGARSGASAAASPTDVGPPRVGPLPLDRELSW